MFVRTQIGNESNADDGISECDLHRGAPRKAGARTPLEKSRQNLLPSFRIPFSRPISRAEIRKKLFVSIFTIIKSFDMKPNLQSDEINFLIFSCKKKRFFVNYNVIRSQAQSRIFVNSLN